MRELVEKVSVMHLLGLTEKSGAGEWNKEWWRGNMGNSAVVSWLGGHLLAPIGRFSFSLIN